MLRKNIETFLCCDREWEEAGTVLFGAPFDSTTSYRPGSRFGSAAIRRESYGIESYSPYQDKDLLDSAVFDSGDIELPFGDTALALSQFIDHACGMLFLLNRCYQPYYKWQFRMLSELPELQEEAGILSRLLLREYPEGKETSEAVEGLCAGVARFLRKQGFSCAEGSFLEPHGLSVMEGISDGRIRNMHLMAGI